MCMHWCVFEGSTPHREYLLTFSRNQFILCGIIVLMVTYSPLFSTGIPFYYCMRRLIVYEFRYFIFVVDIQCNRILLNTHSRCCDRNCYKSSQKSKELLGSAKYSSLRCRIR